MSLVAHSNEIVDVTYIKLSITFRDKTGKVLHTEKLCKLRNDDKNVDMLRNIPNAHNKIDAFLKFCKYREAQYASLNVRGTNPWTALQQTIKDLHAKWESASRRNIEWLLVEETVKEISKFQDKRML
jgi:hypothetical protein